jgi:hypothetical protein
MVTDPAVIPHGMRRVYQRSWVRRLCYAGAGCQYLAI